MNNFVESNYDSFEKKTKVNLKQPIPVTICNDCLGVERIGISYTIEQAANSDAEISLIVILGTQNPDLRIDEFLIKLNDEELLRCEIVAGFEGKGLVCILSISDLEKICDAQSVEMRIKNSEGHTDFTSDEIKFGAQVVYNAFVDENAYIEDIQKREKELVELQQKLESEKLSETKKFNQRIERIRTKGVNKFFTTDYDKFNQKLTVYLKEAVELKGIEGSLLILESKVSFLFVYINEELPVLVIDFRAISRSGLNLKNGELLLLIDDKKRLSLEPHESFSDTHLQDFHIESDWYAISEDELKALCEARIIEMRITNGNEYQDIATKGLQEAARRFYNAVIDDTTYTDELLTQEEREAAERERQRQEYLAEQERLRKEREAKEAEEARIRAEKRAEWWKQNKKWIISCIILFFVFITSYVIYVNRDTVVASNAKDISIFRFRKTTHVIIPEGITEIEEGAFKDCSGLTSVTIPNSVTSIGDLAFFGCSGLTSVTIGNSVTSIGVGAFADCSGLTSVTIPNSVTSIGMYAFSGCSGLTSVEISNSVTYIGESAFKGCSGLTSMTIGNSVTSIGSDTFCGCSGLTSVTIPSNVTSIGEFAFYYCSGLTSVTIPNSVTSIGWKAFEGCNKLRLKLPVRFRDKVDVSSCKSVEYY